MAWRSIPAALANYLWRLHSGFPRHRSCVAGSGRLHSIANPKPPLAIPGRRCHAAALHPPVGASRQSPHSIPPIDEAVIAIQYVGYLLYIVCDAMPTPGPDARCADALTPLRLSANHFTHSESAYGLGQGQVGLLSAVQAPQQKACRSVPPRHLPFALILCRHSEFPPFLWLTHLRYAPHRHHRTSPSFIPSTCLYLRQGRTVLSQRSISTLRKFDLHGSDLTAQWGRSVGAFLHIPRGREGRGKNERQRGGGCAKPLRGQAPVTPNSLILRSFHLATRYKSEIFVERDPREMANLPVSQIFKT